MANSKKFISNYRYMAWLINGLIDTILFSKKNYEKSRKFHDKKLSMNNPMYLLKDSIKGCLVCQLWKFKCYCIMFIIRVTLYFLACAPGGAYAAQ